MKIITKRIEQADWQQVKRLVQEDMLHVGDQVEDFIRNAHMNVQDEQYSNDF